MSSPPSSSRADLSLGSHGNHHHHTSSLGLANPWSASYHRLSSRFSYARSHHHLNNVLYALQLQGSGGAATTAVTGGAPGQPVGLVGMDDEGEYDGSSGPNGGIDEQEQLLSLDIRLRSSGAGSRLRSTERSLQQQQQQQQQQFSRSQSQLPLQQPQQQQHLLPHAASSSGSTGNMAASIGSGQGAGIGLGSGSGTGSSLTLSPCNRNELRRSITHQHDHQGRQRRREDFDNTLDSPAAGSPSTNGLATEASEAIASSTILIPVSGSSSESGTLRFRARSQDRAELEHSLAATSALSNVGNASSLAITPENSSQGRSPGAVSAATGSPSSTAHSSTSPGVSSVQVNHQALINSTPASPPRLPAITQHQPRSSRMPSQTSSIPLATSSLTAHLNPDASNAADAFKSNLASHLYNAFLTGSCADIRVRVEQWQVSYKLHKVVLVQAAFFHSMFLGGFSEDISTDAQGNKTYLTSSHAPRAVDGLTEIDLVFDDPNITKAAFEICISRLYSHLPRLEIPAAYLPSSKYPLTPSFPNSPNSTQAASSPTTLQTNPQLILSLLATSIYLGQTSVLREALSLVMQSVSPWSVKYYLDFAVGLGGGAEDLPVPGLESLAESMSQLEASISVKTEVKEEPDTVSNHESDDHSKCAPESLDGVERYFYGFAGEKVGEACIAWLCRWGVDLLAAEEAAWDDLGFSRLSIEGGRPPLKIWSYGGLPAEWIRVVISSDAFYVASEIERYRFAKRVLRLRRQTRPEGEEDVEEEALEEIFRSGIYYSHMPFEHLSSMSGDIDPETGMPYVPLEVLQSALWASSDLQTRIVSYKPDGTPRHPRPMTMTGEEIAHEIESKTLSPKRTSRRLTFSGRSTPEPGPSAADKRYWPIPTDGTSRIGDLTLPDLETDPQSTATMAPLMSIEDPFFNFGSSMRLGREIHSGNWAVHEPFRFAVEFWNADKLGEKERAYSNTFFHAGSFFNIYVQAIRKNKGTQLGIYLHRQSMLEPLPTPPVGTPMKRTMSNPESRKSEEEGRLQSPYRDPRKACKVYFSISCSSAMGTSLTRFSSGPDAFTVSQSWGWKSNSLRSPEYLADMDDGVVGWVSDVGTDQTRFKSLRATVVMGVL